MKLEHEFDVAAPVESVWTLLLDLERVAPCLPGGEVTEQLGDRRYAASVKVKLGPMQLTYRGEIAVVEADETARRAVMEGKASETRGQGTARATIATTLEPAGAGTHARVETDLQITGRVAQMGRGIVQDVSSRLIGEFAECLSATAGAAAPPPAAARPISGFRLLLTALGSLFARAGRRR